MKSASTFIEQLAASMQVTNYGDDFLKSLCASEIVHHATFQMIFASADHMAVPYVKTTYSKEWISFYLLNNIMRVDPVVRHSKSTNDSFFWSEISLSYSEKKVMKSAKDYGISTTGFTVPTVDVGPYRGLFSICAGDTMEEEWRPCIEALRSEFEKIAHKMHVLARNEIDPYEDYAVNLSRREIECLRFIAEGKTHVDIADIMGISEHTVRSYCRSLRLKLNCSTLAQAVAKSYSMGLL